MGVSTSGDPGKLRNIMWFRDRWMYFLLFTFKMDMNLLMQSLTQEPLVLSVCKHFLKWKLIGFFGHLFSRFKV